MVNKFTEQVPQNLKVCRKKRKIDDSKIGQDVKIHQIPSKKTRQIFKEHPNDKEVLEG